MQNEYAEESVTNTSQLLEPREGVAFPRGRGLPQRDQEGEGKHLAAPELTRLTPVAVGTAQLPQ